MIHTQSGYGKLPWFAACCAALIIVTEAAQIGNQTTADPRPLVERLGHAPGSKLLIINGDDAGMSLAANQATCDSLEHGLMTSASIMVPCPWFPHIAEYARSHPKADLGIHLVHTCEWNHYRWGPVTDRVAVPGLVDGDGYLWKTVEEVYAHATPDQAATEARAQIRRALSAGVDVTHLDSHMGTLQYDLKYVAVYVQLAKEFDLPLRMASQDILEANGAGDLRANVAAQGIVFPDYLIHGGRKTDESVRDYWVRMLSGLKPGVTELYIHAGLPTEELKAITGRWADRAIEYELFTKDATVRSLIEGQGVKRIGYRELRDLQRRQPTGGR